MSRFFTPLSTTSGPPVHCPPEQLVGLLVHVGGDVDSSLILLHKLQEFSGVQARITIVKVLFGQMGRCERVCFISSGYPFLLPLPYALSISEALVKEVASSLFCTKNRGSEKSSNICHTSIRTGRHHPSLVLTDKLHCLSFTS